MDYENEELYWCCEIKGEELARLRREIARERHNNKWYIKLLRKLGIIRPKKIRYNKGDKYED